jgi:hypothetical protein
MASMLFDLVATCKNSKDKVVIQFPPIWLINNNLYTNQ